MWGEGEGLEGAAAARLVSSSHRGENWRKGVLREYGVVDDSAVMVPYISRVRGQGRPWSEAAH